MLNPLTWLSGLLSALTALAGLADQVMQAWQRAQDRKAGRNEQRVDDLEKSQEAANVRRDVETVVSAADPVQHQRMLDRWRRD